MLTTQNGNVGIALSSKVRNCIEEVVLPPYRKTLAGQELQAKYRKIADKSFTFNDPYESYFANKDKELRARSVKEAVVTRVHNQEREATAINALAKEDPPVGEDLYLDETKEIFRQNREWLVKEAWRAVHGQMSLVERQKSDFQEAISRLSREKRTEEAQQEWENKYIKAVKEALDNRQKNVQDRKYKDLFAVTRQTIRSNVSEEWIKPVPEKPVDSKEKSTSEANRQGVQTGGGGPSKGLGEGTGIGPGGGGGEGKGPGAGSGGGSGGGGSCFSAFIKCLFK